MDLDDPASINIYASSFENKEAIEQAIADYNATVDDLEQIQYTDYVGLMMSSVTSIINAITYVLIAFVAVSLIVSSIMIGVITLISVQERTKEIGILRAIGASKRNVSSMFNAETLIIGFTSGAPGGAYHLSAVHPHQYDPAPFHRHQHAQRLSPPLGGLGSDFHQHGADPVLRDHPLQKRCEKGSGGGAAHRVKYHAFFHEWVFPAPSSFVGKLQRDLGNFQ